MRKKLLLKDFLDPDILNAPHSDIAYESIMDGNINNAYSHLDEQCYDVFKMLSKENTEKSLFRFVRFKKGEWNGNDCYVIKDIRNKSITLSNPKNFNDPMDPLIKAWVERRKIDSNDKTDKKFYNLIEKTLDKIRICCLVDPTRNSKLFRNRTVSIEDCSPLMWAHYADSHKGICIQYKVKPSNIIDSEDKIVRLADVEYNKKFPLDGNISFVDSLFVKGKCWKYENETRLIMFSTENIRKKDYYTLDGFEIEAVYMGCKIDDAKSSYLKKMLKHSNIKLFQMTFADDDIRKLIPTQIV